MNMDKFRQKRKEMELENETTNSIQRDMKISKLNREKINQMKKCCLLIKFSDLLQVLFEFH